MNVKGKNWTKAERLAHVRANKRRYWKRVRRAGLKYEVRPQPARYALVDTNTVDIGPRAKSFRADFYRAILSLPDGKSVVYEMKNRGRRQAAAYWREYKSLVTCVKRFFLRRGINVSHHIVREGANAGNVLVTRGHAPYWWMQMQTGVTAMEVIRCKQK